MNESLKMFSEVNANPELNARYQIISFTLYKSNYGKDMFHYTASSQIDKYTKFIKR